MQMWETAQYLIILPTRSYCTVCELMSMRVVCPSVRDLISATKLFDLLKTGLRLQSVVHYA